MSYQTLRTTVLERAWWTRSLYPLTGTAAERFPRYARWQWRHAATEQAYFSRCAAPPSPPPPAVVRLAAWRGLAEWPATAPDRPRAAWEPRAAIRAGPRLAGARTRPSARGGPGRPAARRS